MNSLPGLPLLLAALVIALIACGPSAPYDEAEAPFTGVTASPQEEPATPPESTEEPTEEPTETPTSTSTSTPTPTSTSTPTPIPTVCAKAKPPDGPAYDVCYTPPTPVPPRPKLEQGAYDLVLKYEEELREAGESNDGAVSQRQIAVPSGYFRVYPNTKDEEEIAVIGQFLTDNGVEYQLDTHPTRGYSAFTAHMPVTLVLALEQRDDIFIVEYASKPPIMEPPAP